MPAAPIYFHGADVRRRSGAVSPARAGREPRCPGVGPAAGAVARDGDRPPRQQGAADALGREGRRPPGVVGVDGRDHDRAVVRAPARAGPRLGQAARRRRCCTRSTTCSASSTRSYLTDAARVRRAAELSEPGQGPRPRRLLDRLGRHRRDRDDLERARPPLRGGPLRGRRGAGARSRCSATPSSTRARSGRRSSTRWSAELGEVLWIVDLNRQSLDRVVPGHRRRPARARCSRRPAGR